ncbi:MAG: FAD:protein FMN transferase [Anaerolineaceae bacterium]|nr:FAD:protein FMN transferase [Anaerolineaceae bacterium]
MSQLYYVHFKAMGCHVTAQFQSATGDAEPLAQVATKIEAIENRLSRFRPESELMQLNARTGQWVAVSETLFAVIHAAKHAARLTDGLYNPLMLPAMIASGYDRSFEQVEHPTPQTPVPAADWREIGLRVRSHEVYIPSGSALDLGGIGKGWTAAKIADDLAQYGSCIVNMGGDMAVRGAPDGLPGWEVEIEDPANGQVLASLSLQRGAVVTSGTDYRRWQTADGRLFHHILNPATGLPAETDILTATVIHPDAAIAEAYAKAVMLKGSKDGLHWLNNQWNAAGLIVLHNGEVQATSNFAQLINEGVPS